MKKKSLAVTVFAVLAGIGIYKAINSKQAQGATGKTRQPRSGDWTTEKMPDLASKVAIVTGGNSGIGYEAAKEFARRGARTVLACRNISKGKAAQHQIRAEVPNAPVEVMVLDLASLASVRAFAEEFKANYDRLELLINNAGIMMVPYGTTEDGFERQFGTNHLGHFALTGLLFDLLRSTPGARVVNISSNGHRMGSIEFDNLMYEGGNDYSPVGAYGRSKLANLLFTNELQRVFDAAGIDAVAVAAHPGTSNTNLSSHLEDKWYYRLLGPLMEPMTQSAAMGALPTLRAAVDPGAKGGDYYGPQGFAEMNGYPVVVQASDAARDVETARRLWQVSEELTGVSYGALEK